ncbi:MAG: hypothetical protein WBS19_08490 [Candidatus Korobacteraceae bacterium]
MDDKTVIESWVKLYNRVHETSFALVEMPDVRERRLQAIDAVFADADRNRLAVEHTLIQPFVGQKRDDVRFLETLGALENEQSLILSGHTIHVSQPVACIPTGFDWSVVRETLLNELRVILPTLTNGPTVVPISIGGFEIPLTIWKTPIEVGENSSFGTSRNWPGNPGEELVLSALRTKIPKLARHRDAKKILLLEKDAVAGTIESQFEHLQPTDEVKSLLQQIDEIWAVNTVSLEKESVIFADEIWPNFRLHVCSLNLTNGDFWKRPSS